MTTTRRTTDDSDDDEDDEEESPKKSKKVSKADAVDKPHMGKGKGRHGYDKLSRGMGNPY
jgi:hypothetical protein